MIYFARAIFLIGSSMSVLGLFLFGIKLLYEPQLPEALQGDWLPLFFVIAIFFVLSLIGQRLGNDLLGAGHAVRRKTEEQVIAFEKADWFSKMLRLDFIHSVHRFFSQLK